MISRFVNVTTGEVETIDSIALERDAFRNEALANEERRATAQDTLDNVLLSNDETNARHQEEIRRREAQNKELDARNAKLLQRLEYLEREHEIRRGEAARHCSRNTAYAAPQEFVMTPENQEDEVLAPVSEVVLLLIGEPESTQKD